MYNNAKKYAKLLETLYDEEVQIIRETGFFSSKNVIIMVDNKGITERTLTIPGKRNEELTRELICNLRHRPAGRHWIENTNIGFCEKDGGEITFYANFKDYLE